MAVGIARTVRIKTHTRFCQLRLSFPDCSFDCTIWLFQRCGYDVFPMSYLPNEEVGMCRGASSQLGGIMRQRNDAAAPCKTLQLVQQSAIPPQRLHLPVGSRSMPLFVHWEASR